MNRRFNISSEQVKALLKAHLNDTELPESTELDKQVFTSILGLIENLDGQQSFYYEYATDLECDDLNDDKDDQDYEPVFEPLVIDETYTSYDYCKEVVDWSKNEGKNWSFTTLQHKYRRLKYRNYLQRYEKYVEEMGTAREKFVLIAKYVYDEFVLQRALGNIIHDRNLRLWAVRKARELNLPSFKASAGWLQQFKIKYRISSRRITSLTTRKKIIDEEDIVDNSISWVMEFNENTLPIYQPSQIINIDQSGFRYVHLTNRTLSFLGEKDTQVVIQNKNATTHSYTIMPMLSMDGRLRKPLYICLQETTGNEFGPIVQGRLPNYPNVYVKCSKSGKMSSDKMQEWAQFCLADAISHSCCLITDSWGGQTDINIFRVPNLEIEVKTLPNGSTSYIQPLDQLVFHPWKDFVKRFVEHALLEQIEIDLQQRNVIIKLHSLIMNQFQSPIFRDMFIHAWRMGQFEVESEHRKFKGLRELLFEFNEYECCTLNCNNNPFILCAHCRKPFCFNCFFTDYHYHLTDF